jgi:hypothetical protein
LTQYRRVLFFDGDVMPTGNLDYLFELSDGPDAILKPNLVLTGNQEPANGGFFMLAPGEGELEEMNEIIHQREVKAQSLPHPYFDEVTGWGHVILPPDKWDHLNDSGTNWTFLGRSCRIKGFYITGSSTQRKASRLPTTTRFRILEPYPTVLLSSKRLWIALLRIIPSPSNA